MIRHNESRAVLVEIGEALVVAIVTKAGAINYAREGCIYGEPPALVLVKRARVVFYLHFLSSKLS